MSIEAFGLTKRYGDKTAVDGLTFSVQPGMVTGFLGPNGAGKSTTMRLILGLDRATTGTVTVNGAPYIRHRQPLSEVGALLEARAVHNGRTAYNHLLAVAEQRDRTAPDRRGSRPGRSDRGGQKAGGRLLARYGPAPRARHGAP